MKQTGLIITTPQVGEWIAGQETGIRKEIRCPDRSWLAHLPQGEIQYRQYLFDTMSCTTFSALNSTEMQLHYLYPSLSQNHKDFLRLFGYGYNFSDRFTAIMSGTTERGNTFPNVWDSIRNNGLLPDKDLPFTGSTWYEYHDKEKISPYMKRKARKFIEFFKIEYEWVNTREIQDNLKYSPVHIAVPNPAVHAEVLISKDEMFDTYNPFVKPVEGVHFAMIGYVTPKVTVPSFPKYTFTKVVKKGDNNKDVLALQKILCYFGHMNVVTGFFGDVTVGALKEFQEVNGINPVGQVGPVTQAFINKLNN